MNIKGLLQAGTYVAVVVVGLCAWRSTGYGAGFVLSGEQVARSRSPGR